jgi:hypothetical protein
VIDETHLVNPLQSHFVLLLRFLCCVVVCYRVDYLFGVAVSCGCVYRGDFEYRPGCRVRNDERIDSAVYRSVVPI